MARKEINVFGTSFLDLLSGALAAVIILFVIIPKGIHPDPALIEKIEEIQELTNEVESALEIIKNSVPKEVLEQIKEELDDANSKLKELTARLAQLEEEIKKISSENAEMKETIRQQQEEIDSLKEEITALKETVDAVTHQNQSTANTVEKTLGVFAKFGITCRWSEINADVDIGVQRFGYTPDQCWRMYPSKPWGILGEDVRERLEDGEEERFELFYVPQIYPDEYTLFANVYEKSVAASAKITCTMVFHPGKPDEVRRELGPFAVDKNHATLVVSFRLTQNGFVIIPTREPIWGKGRVVK